VTGAAGFVGANLARRLLAEGHDTHLLTRPGSDLWRLEEVRRHVGLHETDLADDETIIKLCGQIRPEWIFHLAAYGAYASQADTRRMVQTNIVGTLNVVNAMLRVGFETFVNTGSSSEYGLKDRGPGETEAIEPNSDYAVTKASATLLCRSIARRHGVRIQTLRLYSVYGPYEEPTRLMPTLIVRGLSGKLPPLVRSEIARDYVYAADVTEAYLLAAEHANQEPGDVYNVGTGVQTSIGDVVELTRRVLGVTVEAEWASMPDRAWDTIAWVANSTRIRERLGWLPRYTLEAGFQEMVRWFLDNPQQLAKYSAYQR
jgi:nucleoside-diphosphate-sugar epimerase